MITVENYFKGEFAVWTCAPGRVNLLGEHTDYNDGFVLPIAIPQLTCVAVAPHVISENERVLMASRGVTAERFGALMNASHSSLRDDYEVSIPALDRLSALLREHVDVFGARLTDAGFGGACIGLCREGRAHTVAEEVLRQYSRVGGQGRILLPESS